MLELETFSPYVWECACGEGHLSEVLKSHGYKVRSSDIINRGYPGTEILDFLKVKKEDIKPDLSQPEINTANIKDNYISESKIMLLSSILHKKITN